MALSVANTVQTWKHVCLMNCWDQHELFSFGISWCAEAPKRIGREVYMIKLLLASHESDLLGQAGLTELSIDLSL